MLVGYNVTYVCKYNTYTNKDVETIQGNNQVFVLKDGSMYKMRFNLVDSESGPAASDTKVSFVVTNDETGNERYRQDFDISASDSKHRILNS